MKKLILIVVCLCCLLWLFEPLLAANAPADTEKKKQDSLRAVRLENVAAFRSVYPGIELHANPVTGVPEHLYGDISKGQTKSEPVEAAYEFLEQNKDLYGIANPRDELKVKGVAKDQYGAMVDLKQVYNGVDIYQAGMSVHFTSFGKLKGITGGFAQIPDLSTTPSIDSLSAISIAKRDLNYTADDERKAIVAESSLGNIGKYPVNGRLLVASHENRFHLVWIIKLFRSQPYEAWVYRVDAHTGAILGKGSALLDAEPIVPISGPKPVPGKKQESPKPKLERVPEGSEAAPKQIPKQESSSLIKPAPINL